jgi:uncharacterized membrane-anchored protein
MPSNLPQTPAYNRVPRVTVDFWLIKLMAVTVGETAADYLAVNLGLGLPLTSVIMTVVLIAAIAMQFAQRRYVPVWYWVAVVLVSVVGTLLTDNLVDNFGVPLEVTTVVCAVLLAITFIVWFWSERTLSIHSIFTTRREAFYWVAILLTFALGTAAGDLVAEKLDVGYLLTAIIFAVVIGAIAVAWWVFKLNAVLAFWLAYILTRPMGASFGDLLSQPMDYGGLGLGTIITSVIFLAVIAATIVYMTITHRGGEVIASDAAVHPEPRA